MKEAREYQRLPRTAKHVAEALFWAMMAAAVSGTLTIMSRDGGQEPAHRVRVDCATGQLLDVLRDGSGDSPACFSERP